MAYPDDPYAPLPVTPWASWEDSPWASYGQPEPLQPGIGVPAPLLTSSMPQEIEMPPMDVSQPEAQIGFPTSPDEQPAPPVPPDNATDAAFQLGGASVAGYPRLVEPEPEMQPGLGGIPAHLLTDAAQGQAVADQFPPAPQEEGELEFPPDQITEQDRRQSLNDMSGPDFAEFSAEHAEAARASAAGSLIKAEHERAKQAEDDYKIYTDARTTARETRAAVEADAARLAAEEPQTWMESRSGFQKVAAVMAAIIGGLVQGRTGSARNSGMDMINESIQQYGREQATIHANKRQAINDRRGAAQATEQDAEDDYRASVAHQASAWEQTIRMLDAEAGNYDQAGTSAIRIAGAKRHAIAEQQAILAAYEEREIKRMEAAGKSQLEIAKFIQKSEDDARKAAEDAKHHRASERAAQTSAGASYLTAKTGARKADAEIKALEAENTPRSPDHYEATYGKEGRPPHEMTGKEYKAWLDSKNKIADVTRETAQGTVKQAAARLEGTGPGGSPYALGDQEGKPYKNRDGSVFEIKDDKQRQRATEIITSAQNVRRIADLVKIMREDKGGASSTIGSPEYMELQSLASQLDFETFVGYGLGAPSEGDKQLAANVRGGKDITSFIYDPSSGFEAYATGIEEKATAQLRPLGYTGDAIKLKRTEAVQATERNQIQNMDVWSPPELLDESVDPAIRKRAAARAIESADALARQSDPHIIRQLAKENRQRLEAGLIDEKQAEKAQKAFQKVYARRIREATKAGDVDALEALGITQEQRQLGVGGGLDSDKNVIRLLGGAE